MRLRTQTHVVVKYVRGGAMRNIAEQGGCCGHLNLLEWRGRGAQQTDLLVQDGRHEQSLCYVTMHWGHATMVPKLWWVPRA